MMNSRRVIIATLLGLAAGILCYLGGKFLGKEFNTVTILMILLHRTVLGFVVGISALRIHWALHGTLLGLVIGLPVYPLAYVEGGAIAYSLMSVVWGFFIELFTSVIFKAKAVTT
jgi:hypothetical protein